jgi:archaemetzincin
MERITIWVLILLAIPSGGCSPSRGEPASSTARAVTRDPFAFDRALFAPKRPPGPHDWLTSHPEPGQTFAQYLLGMPVVGVDSRRVIVLQPLGPLTAVDRATLTTLADFAQRYFQRPVRVAPPLPLPTKGQRTMGYGTHRFTQYLTSVILDETLRPRLPPDALCYLGITGADLYPEEGWNYVFGQAYFKERVGVYSLGRYGARFWGKPETDASRALFLRRALKVLAHETGHMFSLWHCTEQECLMNGSNNLRELDENRLHLCPACLKKLHWNLAFDVGKRYQALGDFYRRHGLGDDAAWMARRLRRLASSPTER